jgi:hypothetical protein
MDLTGQKFVRLRVLGPAPKQGKYSMSLCICDCGKQITVRSSNLKQEHTKSCGCISRFNQNKHNHSKRGQHSPTYISWMAMKARCTNPNHKSFANYGGRQIGIDPTWLGSRGFETFLGEMGPRPQGTWLERHDNDDDYYRENCTWATPGEQRRNQRQMYKLAA